jgi:transcriptional regulator with XRE-family HTH domain
MKRDTGDSSKLNRLTEILQVNLRRLRERQQLSQTALAERAGLTKAAVNYIERGHRVPNFDTLERLADALECRVEDFYTEIDIASLLRLHKLLSEDAQRAREENDEERLQDILLELHRITTDLNRYFGPFTEPEASVRRRERKQVQEYLAQRSKDPQEEESREVG